MKSETVKIKIDYYVYQPNTHGKGFFGITLIAPVEIKKLTEPHRRQYVLDTLCDYHKIPRFQFNPVTVNSDVKPIVLITGKYIEEEPVTITP